MTSALRKVQPGDPLRTPADTFNSSVDAARFVKEMQHGIGGLAGRGGLWAASRPTACYNPRQPRCHGLAPRSTGKPAKEN